MISYDLAKKLKGAGFPQHPHYNKSGNLVGYGLYAKEPKDENWAVIISIPTLSELIDACGDKFSNVGIWNRKGKENKWGCNMTYSLVYLKPECEFLGSTYDEAVANLWLALNKKA